MTKNATVAKGSSAHRAAIAQGRQDEKDRYLAIVKSAEAQGRESLASSVAVDTDMSVPEARAFLSTAPLDAPTAHRRPGSLAQAMTRLHPAPEGRQ
jgi:hypothetical protein